MLILLEVMHTLTFKPGLLDFRGAISEDELATFVAGCFKAPCAFGGIGLVIEGLFNEDDCLGGGGLVGEGFLSPLAIVDGCFNGDDDVLVVGFLRPLVSCCCGLLLGVSGSEEGGGGLETEEGGFSPIPADDDDDDADDEDEEGCFNEDEGGDIPDIPVNLEGREVPPPGGVIPLLPGIPLVLGFRKPLILEAPVEGGMIPELGALIASSTFGSSTSSVSWVWRTKIPWLGGHSKYFFPWTRKCDTDK